MWHKGDLVKESERLLDMASALRKISCPDRPREWACYSLNDWKQMTEAEWHDLPELLELDGYAACETVPTSTGAPLTYAYLHFGDFIPRVAPQPAPPVERAWAIANRTELPSAARQETGTA